MLGQGEQLDQDFLDQLVCFNCSVFYKARDLRNHKGSNHTQFSVDEILGVLRDQVKNLRNTLNEFFEVELQDSFRQTTKKYLPQFQSELEELMKNYPILIEQYQSQINVRQEECNILSNEGCDISYMTYHIKIYKEYFLRGDIITQETLNLIREIQKLDKEFKISHELEIEKLINSSNQSNFNESQMEQKDFSKFQIKNLNDGSTYQGEWQIGEMHGFGKLTYTNGSTFIGEFNGGKRNGKGTLEFISGEQEGDRCEAEFIDDQIKNNQVKYFYAIGDIYQGTMINFIKEGEGEMQYKNGDIYIGEWKGGFRHGRGLFKWPEGDKYEGEWKDGKRNGLGIFQYKSGNRYEGQFHNNLIDGQGIIYFNTGNRYQGQFNKGQINGQGIFYYPSGNRHEGQYMDGQPKGQGSFFFTDGSYYIGAFRNSTLFNGIGTYVRADGTEFEGEWIEDKLNGKNKWDLDKL